MQADTLLPDEPLSALFERNARTHADRIAVRFGHAELTFAELNAHANQIAHRLLASGSSGDRVAVLMAQDLPSFAALLAGFKAGRIVVVLNPADPPGRLGEMIADADPSAILTDAAHRPLADGLSGGRAAVLPVDEDLRALPASDLLAVARPGNDAAMIVYTSGTTGKPKGAMMTHGAMRRGVRFEARALGLTVDDRIIVVTSLWGGLGFNTVCTGLIGGARLVLYPANVHGVTGLAECLIREDITLFPSASSLFRHFVKSLDGAIVFPGVRYVRLSSDPAMSEDFHAFCRLFPNARLVSTGGASEAGTYLGWLEMSRGDKVAKGRLPVGRPVEDVKMRIVDEAGRDVPPGTVGTIVINAKHHVLGYWRDPETNARLFSVTPDGRQEYRTSDLGWIDDHGRMVLAGRRDATYKIRGQRVDLSEVQRGLAEIPEVAAVAVTAATRPNGEVQLVAYVVPAGGAALSSRRLRALARALMPRHFVPSAFVFLDDMPRTGNGKPDLARLREMAAPPRALALEPPRGETEAMLARIWEEAFEQDGIGRSDDFFDLGGESLIAAVIAARVHAAVGAELNFGTFVDHPRLADLAAHIEIARRSTSPREDMPLAPADRSRPLPLSLLQRVFCTPSRAPHNAHRFTGAIAERIDGRLDVGRLRDSVAEVFARHEILRTRFPMVDGEPVQVVEPGHSPELPLVDWSSSDDGENRVAALLESERYRVFDIAAAPPLALSLVKTAPDVHWLVMSIHHIIADAQSTNIFIQDVAAAYGARADGNQSAPSPLTLQFGDFAAWQRRLWRKDSQRLRSALAFWQAQFAPGLVPSQLPLRSGPAHKSLRPSDWSIPWGLAPATSKLLDELAYSEGATFYMVRLAGFLTVIAALTGRDDAVIGGVFTNRNRLAYERMFGCFANLVTIALRPERQLAFRAFVGRVRRHVGELQAYAEIPHAQLVEDMAELGIKTPQLPLLMHIRTPQPPVRAAGLEFSHMPSPHQMPRATVVGFDQFAEAGNCYIDFDARLTDRETMEVLRSSLVRFFDLAAAEPDLSIGDLIVRARVEPSLRAEPIVAWRQPPPAERQVAAADMSILSLR